MTPAAASRSVFLYDGDCAFCSTCARFVQRRIPTPADVVAWQHADLGALGVTEAECDTAVQWVRTDASGRGTDHVAGVDAIVELLGSSRPWWRVAGVLLRPAPVRALARPVYAWISTHRDRMPGGTATCALPAAQRPGGQPRSDA